MITLYSLPSVPDFARGLTRDLRVRWALEEAGLPYQEVLPDAAARAMPDYRAVQPFGQTPACVDDGVGLFESGAIVFHIAEQAPTLMPADADARMRTICWMFAAVNTIEPPCHQLAEIDLMPGGAEWKPARRPEVVAKLGLRLSDLVTALAGRPFIMGAFSAADILIVTALRMVAHGDLLAGFPDVRAYMDRSTARPAFQRALASQAASYLQADDA